MFVNDGLCFTRFAQYDRNGNFSKLKDTEVLLFIYTSFVSEHELKYSQKIAISKAYNDVYRQMWKDFVINERKEKLIEYRKSLQ